jgi:hypothetical protein
MTLFSKITENDQLRSQLGLANEEIKRLRARSESSEADLRKYMTASNLSHVADFSSRDDIKGMQTSASAS